MNNKPAYLHWDEKTLTPEEVSSPQSSKLIEKLYAEGYVFTRKGRGVLQQTRSIRIDLTKFDLSSENRRILKKVEDLKLVVHPLPFAGYDWSLGKLAKDFYDAKFGPGTFSAQKVKEMLTDATKSNFNALLVFSNTGETDGAEKTLGEPVDKKVGKPLGYCIAFVSEEIVHYSYPFYDLVAAPKDMGLGMMTKALQHFKDTGVAYAYLGSLQRPTDTYKLQFKGIEWFDGESQKWSLDTEAVKNILAAAKDARPASSSPDLA